MPTWLFIVLSTALPVLGVGALLVALERLPGLRPHEASGGAPTRGPRAVAAVLLVGGLLILAAAPTLPRRETPALWGMVALAGLGAAAEGARAFLPQFGRPLYWLARLAFVGSGALLLLVRLQERAGR